MNHNLSNCEIARKKFFRTSTGFEPVASAFALQCSTNCLNCDSLRWSHIHFICVPTVHIISFCVSFFSRVVELNKLVCLQCMGLHRSAGRVLQRERRGHGLKPVEAPKNFFGLFYNCLNCDSLRWSHSHFICIPAVHIISFFVSFLSWVDELNKLTCLQCTGLPSSAVRTLPCKRRGHRFETH